MYVIYMYIKFYMHVLTCSVFYILYIQNVAIMLCKSEDDNIKKKTEETLIK